MANFCEHIGRQASHACWSTQKQKEKKKQPKVQPNDK